MRSGHASPALGALVWALVTLYAGLVGAQPHVACVDPANPELVARIRGQTRDLPIRLSYVRAQLGPSPAPEALQALATRERAQLVVQMTALPDGAHAVLIYDAERHTLRRREAPRPARRDRFGRSAMAETVALIVRGELTDALHAREQEPAVTGAPAPEDNPTPPPSAAGDGAPAADSGTPPTAAAGAPARAPDAPDTPPPSPKRPAAPPPPDREDEDLAAREPPASGQTRWLGPWSFALGAGVRLAYAGPERLFAAALLRLALHLPHLTLAVSGSTSLPDAERVQTLGIRLREHTAVVELAVRIPLAQALELSLGPAGGVAIHQRNVQSADPDWLLPRAARTHVSATLGARAELALRPAQHFAVCVQVGLDLMLRPLRFDVAPEDMPTISRAISELNAWRPWLGVRLQAEL